jgi:hypothetical protein
MYIKLGVAVLLVSAPFSVLQAQSMPVSTFLEKADALKAKGAMAVFSSDLKLLQNEAQSAGRAVRADQVAAFKAGRTPTTCIPERAAVNSDELIAHLRAIPPARRNMPLKEAMASLMARKFPCPG